MIPTSRLTHQILARSLVAILAVVTLLPAFSPRPAVAAGDCTVDATKLETDAVEGELLRMLNAHRAANNLDPVQQSGSLRVAATWMSVDQAKRNLSPADHKDSLGRDTATRFADCGYTDFDGAVHFWENICCTGTSKIDTAEAAFTLWKNSPTHNENMLQSIAKFAGVSKECTTEKCYWTLTLGTNPKGATDAVPPAPAGGGAPANPPAGGGAPADPGAPAGGGAPANPGAPMGGGAPAGPVGAPAGGMPSFSTGEPLQNPSYGDNIMALQFLLKARGAADIVLDGAFEDQTDGFVKDFQAKNNVMPANGVVGPETWGKLWAPLKLNAQGDTVRAAQTLLVWHTLDIDVSGVFGPETEDAVKIFQEDKGVPVTGEIDIRTWAALVGGS